MYPRSALLESACIRQAISKKRAAEAYLSSWAGDVARGAESHGCAKSHGLTPRRSCRRAAAGRWRPAISAA